MGRYDVKVLNRLLDSYERSLLSQGKNKVAVHISFPFTKKIMPEYFNESSLAYEDIHSEMKALEERGFLSILWKGGREGHIMEKVILREEKVTEVYAYVGRKSKARLVQENLDLLEKEKAHWQTPVVQAFLAYLTERLREGKPVGEFIKLEDLQRTGNLILALGALEENKENCYIREFSIRHFGNSKTFESLLGLVEKVMRRFRKEFEDMDAYGILAEYFVYHTPDYVYMKGKGRLVFEKNKKSFFELSELEQGIGLSGEDIGKVRIQAQTEIKKIITIENLTTFYRWQEKDSLLVYLGGYHNGVRRKLLHMLYQEFPNARYLHFGDIDVGGFEIYRDLCRKTGIPFQTYHMGIYQLEKYKDYSQELTDNDRKRLDKLIEKMDGEGEDTAVLKYMKETGRKLEQEGIGM